MKTRIADRQVVPVPFLQHAGMVLWLVLIIGFWLFAISAIVSSHGIFDWLGYDYAPFWAAGRAVFQYGPAASYRLDTLDQLVQPLAQYLGSKNTGLAVAPGLYSPLFFVLLAPFSLLPGIPSFVLWTLSQALLALYVLNGLASRFCARRLLVTAVSFFFIPLSFVFIFGQSTVLPLVALYLAYRDFERGREFRAGLWLGVLFIKPQYALLFPLVLLYKRRWRALAGVALVVIPCGIASLALLGPDGIANARELSRSYSGFQHTYLSVYPKEMLNWRGILINLFPSLSESRGQILTLAMSALTTGLLIPIWRGTWSPNSPRFSVQILGTVIVVLLTAYHSHIHGAALLLVPALVVMAQSAGPRLLRWLIGIAAFLLPLCFAVLFFSNSYVAAWDAMKESLIILMVIALALSVREGWCRAYRAATLQGEVARTPALTMAG